VDMSLGHSKLATSWGPSQISRNALLLPSWKLMSVVS